MEYEEEEEEAEEEEEGDGHDIGGIWQIAGGRRATRWEKSSHQCGRFQHEKRTNKGEGSANAWEVLTMMMRNMNKDKFSTWVVAKKNGKKLKLQSTLEQWTQWDHEH